MKQRDNHPPAVAQVIDLTIPLANDMDAFPGEPTAAFTPFSTLDDTGIEMWNVTLFSQLGTHIDAPSHFMRGGTTIESIDLEACFGPATVLSLIDVRSIDVHDLRRVEPSLRRTRRLLIHTGWDRHLSTAEYWSGFPELTLEAAIMLAEWGVRFLGLDTPTPSLTNLHAVHATLLGARIVLAECLINLGSLGPVCFLCASPLPLVGLDGAPARIVALNFQEGNTQ